MSNYKEINIGKLIKQLVIEREVQLSRICNFFKYTTEDVEKMYQQVSMDSELMLKWSKLLEFDFFRVYTQHLILYAAPSARTDKNKKTKLPQFRKNIYTKEIINFILEQIESGNKTKRQITEEYKIPKTTLYKWIVKNNITDHNK